MPCLLVFSVLIRSARRFKKQSLHARKFRAQYGSLPSATAVAQHNTTLITSRVLLTRALSQGWSSFKEDLPLGHRHDRCIWRIMM